MTLFSKRRPIPAVGADLKEALERRDEATLASLMSELAEEPRGRESEAEDLRAWAILSAWDKGLACAARQTEVFLEHFPQSRHPVRAEWARHLAHEGKEDDATDQARRYLRDLWELGVLDNLERLEAARHGAGRAFLLMTAAPVTLAARSYSLRLLEFAAQYPIADEYRPQIGELKERLQEELADPLNRAQDRRWEEFYAYGAHGEKIFDLCLRMGFPHWARRVELIEANFLLNPGYCVPLWEVLQIVAPIHMVDRYVYALL